MPKCAALTNHSCLRVTGSLSPCCRFRGPSGDERANGNIYEYRNSAGFLSIKKTMEEGWHSGCEKCKDDEVYGKESLRQSFNKTLSGIDGSIESLELSFSNTCNLTCRMCDPNSSSSWGRLVKANKSLSPYFSEAPAKPKLELESLLGQTDLSKLRTIKYLGGEPFLTTQLTELILYLEKKDLSKNIEFICVTNGSVYPTELEQSLKKFRKVEVNISVDGIDKLCEYIRVGSSWDVVLSNILKWRDFKLATGATVKFFMTIQAYNVHNILSISNLADQLGLSFNYHFLKFPRFLSVEALPSTYLQSTITEALKLRHPQLHSKLSEVQSLPDLFQEFMAYTNAIDEVTQSRLKEIIPDFPRIE